MTNREERSTTQAETIRLGEVREPTHAIEDHALIGDMRTAALVAKDGSIDWMCLPDFDSDACFAALLGTPANGYWKVAPAVPVTSVRRRYRMDTLILETDFVTETGTVRLVDSCHLVTVATSLRCAGSSAA